MALALRALGHKERTERELSEWLRERGVGEAEAEEVLAALLESGGLDDAEFAKRFAEDKRELKGWGPERIREALEARGVNAEQVEAALAPDDEASQLDRAALALAERGLRCVSDEERARALGLLARRGFPLEVGYAAIRRVERPAA
jgi:regulatory protein